MVKGAIHILQMFLLLIQILQLAQIY